MNDQICKAIQERRLLELRYRGHVRIVAPHVYGVDATGDEMLSVYQVAGGSDSGASVGWKSLKVSEIVDIKLTSRRFRRRPEYRHDDRAMREIFCQL